MLLILAYHRVGRGKYGNTLSLLEKHFSWIANNYSTVLPFESLGRKLNLCLTFDDATFDFYALIYPLLKRYHLKAVLAVPTSFIPNTVSLSKEKRLKMIVGPTKRCAPSAAFCSWEELRSLQDSPLLQIASHSMNHRSLTTEGIDSEKELKQSKAILESKLQTRVGTFIYPYGKCNNTVHKVAKKYYSCSMRLGNAINNDWYNGNRLLYRVSGDAMTHFHSPFSFIRQLQYRTHYYWNKIRKK